MAFGEAWFLAKADNDDRGSLLASDGGTAIDSPDQWGANDAVIVWQFANANDRAEYFAALLKQWFPRVDPTELTRGADVQILEQEG